jgi:predicted DNA-binding antitoxin AbrB/MazE fold protein
MALGREGTSAMTKTIHAIFENGVFRPIEPVDLPERTRVEFEPRIEVAASPPKLSKGLEQVYAILGERYETGEPDLAARHDEHQP